MTQPSSTPLGLWLAAFIVSAAGGLVWASSWFLAWSSVVLVGSAASFFGGVIMFGALAFVDARRGGISTCKATRRGATTAVRAFVSLLP